MTRTPTPFEEFQQRRFMRPDAHRWLRPDWRDGRFWSKPPETEERKAAPAAALSAADLALLEDARREHARLRWMLADLRFHLARRRYLEARAYNPNQPRVPAGNPDGGQWTDGDGGGGEDQEGTSTDDIDISASRRGDGHHYVPRGVFGKRNFSEETRKVLEGEKTGPLRDNTGNQYDHMHREYNKAVNELMDDFLWRNQLNEQSMSPNHARTFIQEVLSSRDPRIRGFNMRLWLREIMRRGPRGPRGTE